MRKRHRKTVRTLDDLELRAQKRSRMHLAQHLSTYIGAAVISPIYVTTPPASLFFNCYRARLPIVLVLTCVQVHISDKSTRCHDVDGDYSDSCLRSQHLSLDASQRSMRIMILTMKRIFDASMCREHHAGEPANCNGIPTA
jgi:hypothetical protein